MFRLNYKKRLNTKIPSNKLHLILRKLILDKMLLFNNLYCVNNLTSRSKDWNIVKRIIYDYSLLYGFSSKKFLSKNNEKISNMRNSLQWLTLINSLSKELKAISQLNFFSKDKFIHYFNNINFSRKLISGNKIIHNKIIQPANNLRESLGKLLLITGSHRPLKFKGVFQRFGKTKYINFPTVLLKDVNYHNCVKTNHVWLLYSSKLNSLRNLKPDKTISFLANIVIYYKGHNFGLYDYGLDNPKNIKVLNKSKSLD